MIEAGYGIGFDALWIASDLGEQRIRSRVHHWLFRPVGPIRSYWPPDIVLIRLVFCRQRYIIVTLEDGHWPAYVCRHVPSNASSQLCFVVSISHLLVHYDARPPHTLARLLLLVPEGIDWQEPFVHVTEQAEILRHASRHAEVDPALCHRSTPDLTV